MVPTVAETWWRRSLRRLVVHTLRALPIPGAQKWVIAGIAADLLESPASPLKVAQMAGGFKMLVDLSESYERSIYYSGLYKPYLTRLFKQLLLPGDTLIDGGANIGYFSLLAAKYVGEQGNVHAFEPNSLFCHACSLANAWLQVLFYQLLHRVHTNGTHRLGRDLSRRRIRPVR